MKKELILLLVASAITSNIDAASFSRLGPAARGALYGSRQTFQNALPKGVSNIAKPTAYLRTSAPQSIKLTQSITQQLTRPTYFGQFKNWFTSTTAILGATGTYNWLKKPVHPEEEETIDPRIKDIRKEIQELAQRIEEHKQASISSHIESESRAFQNELAWQFEDEMYGYDSIRPKVLFDEIYKRLRNINVLNYSKDIIVPEKFSKTIRQIALQTSPETRNGFLEYINKALQNKNTFTIAQKMKSIFDEINPESTETVHKIIYNKNIDDPTEKAKIRELIANTQDPDVIKFLIEDRARIFGQRRANPKSYAGHWKMAYMAHAYHELKQGKKLLEILSGGGKLSPQEADCPFLSQWDDKAITPYFYQANRDWNNFIAQMEKDKKEFFEKMNRTAAQK